MQKIQWQISVPILKNSMIWRQLGLAIGFPFGLVTLVIVLSSGKDIYALYGLGLICSLLFIVWLYIIYIYEGRYEVEFVLDKKGVQSRTLPKHAKKSFLANTLIRTLDFFWRLSGRPPIKNGGLLAQSRQKKFVQWNKVIKINWKPETHSILLYASSRQYIKLICRARYYSLIEQTVKNEIKETQ